MITLEEAIIWLEKHEATVWFGYEGKIAVRWYAADGIQYLMKLGQSLLDAVAAAMASESALQAVEEE